MFDHSHIWKSGSRVDHQIAAAQEIGVRFHASRGSLSLGESDGGLPPDEVTEDEAFILEDCLITGNDSNAAGGGLYVWEITDDDPDVYLWGRMKGVTVADNDSPLGSGLYLENLPDFVITRMIVAYNTGSAGIKSVKLGSGLQVGCTLLYGHLSGARWPQGMTDMGYNIEAHPEFCDRTDYWLRADSPALP